MAYVKVLEHHRPNICMPLEHRDRLIRIKRIKRNPYLIKDDMTQVELKSNIKRQNNGYILKNKSTGGKSMAAKSSDKIKITI